MTNSRHTVGVEKLRCVEGFEREHYAITAVVERFGSHVKVCATSVPVQHLEGLALGAQRTRGMTVAESMQSVAQGIAQTYGAEYLAKPEIPEWARLATR